MQCFYLLIKTESGTGKRPVPLLSYKREKENGLLKECKKMEYLLLCVHML